MSAHAPMASAVSSAAGADVVCAEMTLATRGAALTRLEEFLRDDDHYLASSAVYGDGGPDALERALDLFLARPEIGFVWLAFAVDENANDDERKVAGEDGRMAAGACVVCHAISTSRGALVAKLDDVTIARAFRGSGVGSAMLDALAGHLRARGITRIDTACHRANAGAWRFYERLGFRPLDEERIARVL